MVHIVNTVIESVSMCQHEACVCLSMVDPAVTAYPTNHNVTWPSCINDAALLLLPACSHRSWSMKTVYGSTPPLIKCSGTSLPCKWRTQVETVMRSI